jgi:tRNA(Arg) A34 adenosine deaminase TadA
MLISHLLNAAPSALFGADVRSENITPNHRQHLEQALALALVAKSRGQIPIGCVIIDGNGEVLASRHNDARSLRDKTAHAEMLAIREAMTKGNGDAAKDWTLYTTLEPCPMCLSAIILARIGQVVWAAPDPEVDLPLVLKALSYEQKNKLSLLESPFEDLMQQCSKLYQEGRNGDR